MWRKEFTMALVRERDGRRLHVKSKLMGESLVSTSFIEALKIAPQQRLFPNVNILKIGGQSICDRGVKSLPGVIKEIIASKNNHKILITTGGGTRSRS
jgi:molybdenum storage protein